MRLKVIIADERPEVLATWSDVFQNIDDVEVLDTNTKALVASGKIDAELLTSWLAHERYGGKPIPGKSQILSTRGEQGMSPWVITTAPFAAHLQESTHPDGSGGWVLVQDEAHTPEEEDYIVFDRIFSTIDQFNKSKGKPMIQAVGFDLKLLEFAKGDPRKEAEAVHRAYVQHYGCA